MEKKTINRPLLATDRNPFGQDRLVTISDLVQFRNELLKDIKWLLIQKQISPEKQCLKSGEVRKLLQISAGTLQHLRDTGQLPFTKLGGIIYYEREAIQSRLGGVK